MAVGKNIKLRRGEGNIKAVGKNIKLRWGEGNIKAVGKNIKSRWGEENINAVGKNIKLRLREGNVKAVGKNTNLRLGEEIKNGYGELYTPLRLSGGNPSLLQSLYNAQVSEQILFLETENILTYINAIFVISANWLTGSVTMVIQGWKKNLDKKNMKKKKSNIYGKNIKNLSKKMHMNIRLVFIKIKLINIEI